MEYEERIFELRMQGYCCSQIIVQLWLEEKGRENPDLIAAMRGLCNGLQEGKTCGTLIAANCVLYLEDPELAQRERNIQLLDWFEDIYGSLECSEITQGNPLKKIEICPDLVVSTYMKLVDLMDW